MRLAALAALAAMRCLAPLLPDTATIDDYPLTDDALRVGRFPVHIMGRLATLALGPAAGNLWGAQRAAGRIAEAITDVNLELSTEIAVRQSQSKVSSTVSNEHRGSRNGL